MRKKKIIKQIKREQEKLIKNIMMTFKIYAMQ